jgi:hypothetical protein
VESPPGKPPCGDVCPEVRQLRCGQAAANGGIEALCVLIAFFGCQAVGHTGERPFSHIREQLHPGAVLSRIARVQFYPDGPQQLN